MFELFNKSIVTGINMSTERTESAASETQARLEWLFGLA
jgi:hypothetical protein